MGSHQQWARAVHLGHVPVGAGSAEGPHHTGVATLGRYVKRRGPSLRPSLLLRTGAAEFCNDGLVALMRSEVQGRHTILKASVAGSSKLAEGADHLQLAYGGRNHQGRSAVHLCRVLVRPSLAEKSHDIFVAVPGSKVDGRRPGLRGPVRVGSSIAQQVDQTQLAVRGGRRQGCHVIVWACAVGWCGCSQHLTHASLITFNHALEKPWTSLLVEGQPNELQSKRP
mmetsp:Transcript_9483/g.25719  ORF Transcript_9483/g.25719 Transcript_9483/m.25719 type:complete len:225 (-) Transcript_9483:323-997(-)